jgi:hypothetical protein
MRQRLVDAKNANLGLSIGICSTDSRFTTLLNEAQQRIVMGPEQWWKITQRYRISVAEGCITWPRHIAAIESISACGMPMTLRNPWFEFLESGYGLRSCSCNCDWGAYDRGTAVTFDDIKPTGKRLRFYVDVAETAGQTIIAQGYNDSSEWIRTLSGGVYIDGEAISLPNAVATPILSTNFFSSVTALILPASRNGILRLYEYDNAAATQRQIGVYEPDETTPEYRRTFIGGLCDSTARTVDAMVRREFIPVSADNDWLMVANLPSLKLMMMSIDSEMKRDFNAAAYFKGECFNLLTREAAHYTGQGNVAPLRIESDIWNAGNIPCLY